LIRRSRWDPRGLFAGVLLVLQVGCRTLQPVSEPRAYVESRNPSFVVITRTDGTRVSVESPRVFQDTIFGYSPGGEVSVPLAQIGELKARQVHSGRTILFAGGMAAVVLALSIAAFGTGPSEPPPEEEDVLVPVLFRIRF
jgi:hypothetical protein